MGVLGLHANPRGGTRGHRRIRALTLGVGVYGGNATAGTGSSPSPSRPDGNGRGMTGLNLSGGFGKYRPTLQGVKVRQSNSRIRLGNLARATAVVRPPAPRERSAAGNAGALPFL